MAVFPKKICALDIAAHADMLLTVARDFMRSMAQPFDRGEVGRMLLNEAQVNLLEASGGAL